MTNVITWALDFGVQWKDTIQERRATLDYTIEMDDESSFGGFQAILADSRYPLRLSSMPEYPLLLCDVAQPTQNMQVPNAWKLHVEYSTVPNADAQTKFIEDPRRRPALINADSYETTVLMEEDLDGVPVQTAAGETIFYQKPIDYRSYSIQKNVPGLPLVLAKKGNWINSDSVTIMKTQYKKGELHLKKCQLQGPNWENGFLYYVANLLILVNPEGWYAKLRNAGYSERGPLTVVKDEDGNDQLVNPLQPIIIGPPGKRQYPSQPVLLDPKTGRAFRGKDAQGNDVILTPESREAVTGGITKKQWKSTELKLRQYDWLNFSANLPFLTS